MDIESGCWFIDSCFRSVWIEVIANLTAGKLLSSTFNNLQTNSSLVIFLLSAKFMCKIFYIELSF